MKIFDAHCDTLTYLMKKRKTLKNSDGMINAEMLAKYNGYIQVFAAWINQKKENPILEAIEIADIFWKETESSGIVPITDKETLLRVCESGEIGAIFAIEDGIALGGSIAALNMFYRLGCRAITLTWNGKNELGEGAIGSSGKGLTAFGKDVVRRMNELGMVIDVSHLSERGFYDVMEITQKPVMASHSNAKAICNHPRNLTDEQLRFFAKSGSVTGINLYDAFLVEKGDATICDVVRHIEHIISVGGEDIIGIGTDFDGISKAANGLENAGKLSSLFNELSRLNYSDALLEKLAYKNFIRLFENCL